MSLWIIQCKVTWHRLSQSFYIPVLSTYSKEMFSCFFFTGTTHICYMSSTFSNERTYLNMSESYWSYIFNGFTLREGHIPNHWLSHCNYRINTGLDRGLAFWINPGHFGFTGVIPHNWAWSGMYTFDSYFQNIPLCFVHSSKTPTDLRFIHMFTSTRKVTLFC